MYVVELKIRMLLQKLLDKGFDVRFESHAAAILEKDFPGSLDDLEKVLANVKVPITEIVGSGGGETEGTQRMRRALNELAWQKHEFEIKKTIDGVERESISHEVDHVKNFEGKKLALEIEWNNKDPFFDRDLENFKRLHAEGAISVGIIVTRGSSLHEHMREFIREFAQEQNLSSFEALDRIGVSRTRRQRREIGKRVERKREPVDFAIAWADQFVSDKYGEATTHWRKLIDRINRGVGNPCPLLLIGLPLNRDEVIQRVTALDGGGGPLLLPPRRMQRPGPRSSWRRIPCNLAWSLRSCLSGLPTDSTHLRAAWQTVPSRGRDCNARSGRKLGLASWNAPLCGSS